MSNVWKLVALGSFKEACNAADEEYSLTGNIAPLRNKVCALLKLQDYDGAIRLCQLLIEKRSGETSGDFEHMGIAQWLGNDRQSAIVTWKAAQNAKYQDAAGGVQCRLLLWYGALGMGDTKLMQQTEKWLRRRYDKSPAVWPAPLAGFICGALQKDGLIAALSPNEFLAERQWCQAAFYIGLRARQESDNVRFSNWMHKSSSLSSVTWIEAEHYLAVGEVSQLSAD